MRTIIGLVISDLQGHLGIPTDAFDAEAKFQNCLPLKGRSALAEHARHGLSSSIADSNGEFEINYKDQNQPSRWYRKKRLFNLSRIAFTCTNESKDVPIICQVKVVRINAGDSRFQATKLPNLLRLLTRILFTQLHLMMVYKDILQNIKSFIYENTF